MCEHAAGHHREGDVVSQPHIDHVLRRLVGVHGDEERDSLTAAEFRQELFVEYSGQQLWRPPFLRLLLAPSLRLPLGQRTNCARACLFFCPRIDTDKAQVGGNPEDDR